MEAQEHAEIMTTALIAYTAWWTYQRAREADYPSETAGLLAVSWPLLALFLIADWIADYIGPAR